MKAEELFWRLAAELQAGDPRIAEGTIMNGRCLRVGKEFLALVDYKGWAGREATKPRVAELIKSGVATVSLRQARSSGSGCLNPSPTDGGGSRSYVRGSPLSGRNQRQLCSNEKNRAGVSNWLALARLVVRQSSGANEGVDMPTQKYLFIQRSSSSGPPKQPPSPAQMQEMFAVSNAWKEKF